MYTKAHAYTSIAAAFSLNHKIMSHMVFFQIGITEVPAAVTNHSSYPGVRAIPTPKGGSGEGEPVVCRVWR